MTTLLITTMMLSLKGNVPVNNSDIAVIERNSVHKQLENTEREIAQKPKISVPKQSRTGTKNRTINLEN